MKHYSPLPSVWSVLARLHYVRRYVPSGPAAPRARRRARSGPRAAVSNEPCAPCAMACTWTCPHLGTCAMPCGAPCSRLPCTERCDRTLACGHRCPSVCGELCPPPAMGCCRECPATFRDRRVDVGSDPMLSEADLDPLLWLPCGHVFTRSSLDSTCRLHELYEPADPSDPLAGVFVRPRPINLADVENIEFRPTCPDCRSPLTSLHRYGRRFKPLHVVDSETTTRVYVQTALADIEQMAPCHARLRTYTWSSASPTLNRWSRSWPQPRALPTTSSCRTGLRRPPRGRRSAPDGRAALHEAVPRVQRGCQPLKAARARPGATRRRGGWTTRPWSRDRWSWGESPRSRRSRASTESPPRASDRAGPARPRTHHRKHRQCNCSWRCPCRTQRRMRARSRLPPRSRPPSAA